MHQILNYNMYHTNRNYKIPKHYYYNSSIKDYNKYTDLLQITGMFIDSNWLRGRGLEDFSIDFHKCYIDGGGGTTEHQKNCDWEFNYCKFAEGFYHSNYKPYDLSHTLSVNLNDNKYYGYKAVSIKNRLELPTIGIIKLEIPFNAEIRNGNSNKFRASRVTPIQLFDLQFNSIDHNSYIISSIFSLHKYETVTMPLTYNINQEIVIEDFNNRDYTECSEGIHFFSKIYEPIMFLEEMSFIKYKEEYCKI